MEISINYKPKAYKEKLAAAYNEKNRIEHYIDFIAKNNLLAMYGVEEGQYITCSIDGKYTKGVLEVRVKNGKAYFVIRPFLKQKELSKTVRVVTPSGIKIRKNSRKSSLEELDRCC